MSLLFALTDVVRGVTNAARPTLRLLPATVTDVTPTEIIVRAARTNVIVPMACVTP
jgi:hypothetical protein